MYKRPGFTLLEILVAIAIIGLLATVVVPNIFPDRPREEREKFIDKLNALMSFAWQNSMFTEKVHEVTFSFKKRIVSLKLEGEKDKYGKAQYRPVQRAYVKTEIEIPKQFEFRNFYVNSKGTKMIDAMPKAKDGEAYFYIVPDGLSQEVIINFLDSKDLVVRKKRPFGLVLNPFTVQFEVYEEFKRP